MTFAEMKELVIIGAGGMGREIHYTATHSIGYGTEFIVKGFIDDDMHALSGFQDYPSIIGTIQNYKIQKNDVFVCSMGDVTDRERAWKHIKEAGGHFLTLIHQNAIIKTNAKIGEGTIVDAFAIVSCDAEIGEDCLVQQAAIIGHDVKIGKHCRIDCQSFFVGGVIVGDRCTIHTAAVLNHHVEVGDDATVGACSFVIRKVKPKSTVCGNPAKKLEF